MVTIRIKAKPPNPLETRYSVSIFTKDESAERSQTILEQPGKDVSEKLICS